MPVSQGRDGLQLLPWCAHAPRWSRRSAAQGRHDAHFDDRNGELVATLQAQHPGLCSMEMESFQLLHLAACSSGGSKSIRACTAAIVAANRDSGAVITTELLHDTERVGGGAVLKALAAFDLSK